MKTEVTLKLTNLLLVLLLLFLPVSYAAESGAAQSNDIDIEWAAELSREIPWFEAATGKIVRDRIVRRFSLLCGESRFCYLTVVSFPARNCMERNELGKQPRQLLEASQAGSDVDFFEMGKHRSGDLSVVQRGQDSVLIEFTSHEPHRSKNSILVSYRSRFSTGSSKVPLKITGVESGIGKGNSLYVDGDEVVKFEYRQLPASTVCLMGIQSRDLIPR
ncbi:MAG TPA: hypothetical protein VEL80_02520 [Burkholderiales bacterium]|nr:hypothetical protein [Burkholderiales bacterium]